MILPTLIPMRANTGFEQEEEDKPYQIALELVNTPAYDKAADFRAMISYFKMQYDGILADFCRIKRQPPLPRHCHRA
ncbi:unnamed protein product [Diplocarpon coronariae]